MRLFSIIPKRNSGDMARKRLKLLLAADRTDCSPEMIEMVKEDLVGAVSRYMEIDTGGIEIQIREAAASCGRRVPSLYANIPILNIGNKGTF
ncbi:cell division topological specificity factor MinE [Lachnospiraceae bacterium 62-35]